MLYSQVLELLPPHEGNAREAWAGKGWKTGVSGCSWAPRIWEENLESYLTFCYPLYEINCG